MKTATRPYKILYRAFNPIDARESELTEDYEHALRFYYELKHKGGRSQLNEAVYSTLSDYINFNGKESCLLSSK